MLEKLKWGNVFLRAIMELGIVIGFAYWGFHFGNTTGTKSLLGIGLPIIGFGIWGVIDFHQFGKIAEPLRLAEELIISGLAALAFFTAGQHIIGIILAVISILHHCFVYITGEKLLKNS